MIMPKMYRYRPGKSDRVWIQNQMLHIPKDKQQAVADEYERLFRNKSLHMWANRKAANNYLLSVSREYRQDAYAKQKKAL